MVEPLRARPPLQLPPEAVQLVALVLLQVKVQEPPEFIVEGEQLMFTVGPTGEPTVTVTVRVGAEVLSLLLPHCKVKV